MTTKNFLLTLFALVLFSASASAQKYKTVNDTLRLNKEILNVTSDIAKLNERLAKQLEEQPKLQAKMESANKSAENAAASSSDQASKATNGSVKDARRAKSKASKSYNEAKDYSEAKKKYESCGNKIKDYQNDIAKKQKQLDELNTMHTTIMAQVPAANPM